jgi:LL-diaminopimelate aminotransferase
MPVKVPRNENFAKLGAGYLFPVINQKKREFLAANPDAKLISLGIGDTTHPLPASISGAMEAYSKGLGTKEGYEGYDPKCEAELKQKIATVLYKDMVKADEVFVSDGSKCDIGRLQIVFGQNATVAVQDPAYPVYVDSSVIFGRSGKLNETTKQYDGVTYMPCTPENNFFPDITAAKDSDIIMFCNPNNPTGACATRKQLEDLVAFAKTNGKVILFDSAYSSFITDPTIPKSIYEIEGAKECAIETTSFSKLAGFTGIRLGWVVCPSEVKFADGTPVKQDIARVMSTLFNGAANVSQNGGLAALNNMKEVMDIVGYYLENAKLICACLEECGIKYYGGVNAPYTFAHFPGKDSWEMFDEILTKCQVVTTPGVGFGPSGQGFIRISAFGARENVVEACARLKAHFKK